MFILSPRICVQKLGPKGDINKDLQEIDEVCGDLIDYFSGRDVRVILLSEYGISEVDTVVHINRALRQAGHLNIKNDLGREYLDTASSPAFAVADHQIAHVYIRDKARLNEIKKLCESLPGVKRVLDEEGKRYFGLDHQRSGELVLLSKPNAWFSYYFWLNDERAPDYARIVDIHNKPGYDPVELFINPSIKNVTLKVAWALLKKTLGFRYLMDVIPLDASLVRGSHGLPSSEFNDSEKDNPVIASSNNSLLGDSEYAATDVQKIILDHLFSKE